MSNSINLKEFIERISYNKSQTYTKEEVLQELAKIQLLSIVDTLPTENIPSNKIFLVLNDEEIEGNKYDLFVYVNNKWEQIDSLEFNIEDYPTKNELDYELSLKADVNHGHDNVTASSDGFMSKEDKSKLNGIENQATRNLPSDDNPLMDGTASSGTGKDYSRKDHVHPTDTSRASSTHVHGNISNDGKIGSTANKPLITTTSGSVTTGNFETSTNNIKMDGTVNVGSSNNFARSDHVHPTDTSRASTDTATSSKNGLMSKEDKSKLDGVEDEANNYTHPSYTAKTNGLYKVTVDNTGHISGTNTVSGSDLPSHNHDTGDMKDTSAYGNIGSSANATQKTINNNINTKLGQKANSSDVYTKSQTMTSTEIGQAIADGVSNVEIFEVVTTLPTSNIKGNKFYLVPNGENIEGNVYDVNIYVNNKWETIDKLEFDISNYPTTTQVNSLLEGKVDKTDSRLTDSRTPKSHTHGNITNTGAIGSTSGKIVTTGTNGVLTTSDTITKSQISDFPSTMTPSSHTHGAVQNNGTLNSDTTSTNKVVVTDSSNNIKTISKLPLDKVTHQDISGKASSTHTHGSIANNGTLNSDTTTVGKVVVTDGSNNIKTISKLPSANVTHQDISGKAPNNHKSTATTYGVGDASNYGHVKVDSSMNASSTNPVQNKVVKDYIDEQVGDIVSGDVDLSNTHNHDDRYYTESEIDTKLNSKVNTSDSRLTDARNPKVTVIANGTDLNTIKTIGFYAQPTSSNTSTMVNLPNNIHRAFTMIVEPFTDGGVTQTLTFWYDNSQQTPVKRFVRNGTSSWSKWVELTDSRYDGNFISGIETVTKPYLRLFNIKSAETNSSSSHIIFEIIGNNNDRIYAKIRVDLRQDNNTTSTFRVTPLEVYGINLDEFYFALHKNALKTNLDIYRKVTSWTNFYVRIYDDHLRNGTYTMYSPVANGTESYTDLTEASTTLYGSAYSNTSQGGTYPELTNTLPYTNMSANKFVKRGGTSGQFLKADGSVDGNAYLTTSSASSTYLSKTDASNTYQPKGNYLTSHQNITGKADKTNGVSQITDTNANQYTNIGSLSSGATQQAINSAINTKIASLTNIDLVKVVTSLPTASASTMNQLYVVAKSGGKTNDTYNIYVTVKNGSTYTWEKIDDFDLQTLSIAWGSVTGKPTIDTTVANNANNLVTSQAVYNGLNGKAPTSHASTGTGYGVGTSANYGHNKIIDDATKSTLTNGESLSAHMGYILNNQDVEYVASTHTSSTSTWTGTCSKLRKLEAGTKIYYRLNQDPTTTDVTLNLTLADSTTTGAKNVFFGGTRLKNQYPKYAVIGMVYDGSKWIVINQYTNTNTTYTPASATPLIDSKSGTVGTSAKYAREDHTHPNYDYIDLKGTDNTLGYINLIKFTINGAYQDIPIVVKTQHRDKIERSVIQIKFSNVNNNDPSLQSITHTGQDMEFYLYKESTSNWILACGKGHAGKYDDVNIKIDNPNSNITTSKLGTHLASLPTSNITQSTYIGFTSTEKTKLAGIANNANNYSHPTSYGAKTGVPTGNATLTHGGTFTVTQPVTDAMGHVTALNTRTYTLPTDNNTTYSKGNGLLLSGTTFSVDFGSSTDTGSTKVVACNDSRLSNARTPTSHTHGSIANNGTLNSDVTSANMNKLVVTDGSNNIKTAICTYTNGKLNFGSG